MGNTLMFGSKCELNTNETEQRRFKKNRNSETQKIFVLKKQSQNRKNSHEDFQNDELDQTDGQSDENRKKNIEDCQNVDHDQTDGHSDENFLQLIGEHENQVSEGGEADLGKHYANCKKNPGHIQFIHVDKFSLKHLPKGHQNNDLYKYIKVIADLTVRISVTMTSPHRPEFWPNTKDPYFLYDMRGSQQMRTGSGRVCYVNKYPVEDKYRKYKRCPCDKCKHSHKPSNVWWMIYVETATHVVFDETEASHTTFRLFYDREDSPVVILKDKVSVYDVNIEKDMCVLSCVTCDKNLVNKLKKMKDHFDDVWEKVINKYYVTRDVHKLMFIVSHPHGCSKQVSVGQWKDKYHVGDNEYDHKLTYTTCTCPGSSGASVHCVGYDGRWLYPPVHSGSLKSGLNYSGVGEVL